MPAPEVILLVARRMNSAVSSEQRGPEESQDCIISV